VAGVREPPAELKARRKKKKKDLATLHLITYEAPASVSVKIEIITYFVRAFQLKATTRMPKRL